jgi:isopenicillin-N epimerase
MHNLEEHFLLDPTVIFLNHGSFGATPEPVFDSLPELAERTGTSAR